MSQNTFTIRTRSRSFEDITEKVRSVVQGAGVTVGLCNVFLRHTSASLLLCENADPAVRRDLEAFMQRTAPDGAPEYEHDEEGPDDMSAHIRTTLVGASLVIPILDGRLALGTWQGVYLWEHRTAPHAREIVVTVVGE